MIFRRALAYCFPLSLFAALSACAPSCESPKEKAAREEKARSDRHLARLLRTKECVHCNIVDADLRGRDLRGVKLENTALHGDLRGANLTGARIMSSDLGGDLSGIDLREAKVFELSLSVTNGRLAGARLDGLDLRTMRWSECVDWSGVSLRGANLQALSFGGTCGTYNRGESSNPLGVGSGGAVLRGADLRDTNLSHAWLREADLRDTDLRGANLAEARMPPAESLTGAKLEGAVGPNGVTCLPGSVGRCLIKRHSQPPWLDLP
jgi:uncharacterized protein YjbI with pentapeptide repeats